MPKPRKKIHEVIEEEISSINVGNYLISNPPINCKTVLNMYVKDNKLEVNYDDDASLASVISSQPVETGNRIVNIYIENNKLKIDYEV